ncbi:hypothetical protein LNP05_05580 [Klebsiella pneumoniae subsp. pneumoniae]|nr:hypothetical protein [Klebsiella pneumoniae subsp. pneumoniae]
MYKNGPDTGTGNVAMATPERGKHARGYFAGQFTGETEQGERQGIKTPFFSYQAH